MPLAVRWSSGITCDPQLSGTELPYGHVSSHVSYCLNKTLIYNILSDSITVWTTLPQIIFFWCYFSHLLSLWIFSIQFLLHLLTQKNCGLHVFPFFTEMTHHFLKFSLWVKILLSGFETANIKMQNQWKGQTYAEM